MKPKRFLLLDFKDPILATRLYAAFVAAAEKRGVCVQGAGDVGELEYVDPFADLNDDEEDFSDL